MKTKFGIILGSGLNKFSEELSSPETIYEDKNSFHNRKIISGKINNEEVIAFSGRRHFYEGYLVNEVLDNVSIAKELGVNLLIITNAAGGINKNFRVSDLMLITSHYNFLKKNIPVKSFSRVYTAELIDKVKRIAKEEKMNLRYGSYSCASGPMYETKSEIRFLSKLGVDAVGMSTVPEILYAGKLGIKTIAFSCITNILSEQPDNITSHEDVLNAGKDSYVNFSKLLKLIISNNFTDKN